ncbi:MAG: Calx-beta domain-containing protein [Leptospiraceae bacterium]|nr:Calx-beta domain-containing protein [Leptospiraceae bacterium]
MIPFIEKIYKTIFFVFFLVVLSSNACSFKKGFKFFGLIPLKDLEKNFIIQKDEVLFTNEFGRTTSFKIKLSKKPDSKVRITQIISSKTSEGVVTSSPTITFTPDDFDSFQTITVQGVEDGIPDGNQNYRISMRGIETDDFSYNSASVPDVTIINTDKETPSIAVTPVMGLATNESGQAASFSVVLSTQPGADVVIPSFSSDTPSECSINASITFTSKNWDTPQSVSVVGVDDNVIDGAKNCLISSNASTSEDRVYEGKTIPVVTVVNVDNDVAGLTFIPVTPSTTTEAGGQAQFNVVLNTIPNDTVTVTGITTSDATEGTVAPANLSFSSSDWNIPQTLTVSGVDDYMNDGNINYTIVFPNLVSPMDLDYNGTAVSSSPGSFTNLDDDARGFNITPILPATSLTPLTVIEGNSSTFNVSLTSVPCDTPSTPDTCNPTSVTITLTNNYPTEYTITPSSLTFTPGNWNVNQVVTVTAIDDFIDNSNFDYNLSIDPIVSTSDYSGLDPTDVIVQTVNNDTAGFTINPAASITVNENDPGGVGLETTITVVLNSQPTGNVTLGPVISTDTLEIIVAPTIGGGNTPISNRTLVFTPTTGQAIVNSDSNVDTLNDTSTGGWNVPQTVRVRAVVDGTSDGTQTRAIQFGTRSTSDTKYANVGLTPTPDVPATNVDSGIPKVLLQSISAVTFPENGTSLITLQVVLATLPTGNVTISNIVSSDTSEGVVLQNGGSTAITNRSLVFTTTTNQAVSGTNTTTGGWNMPQTITIRSVADSFDDGNIAFTINFPSATGAGEYVGFFPESSNASYNNGTGQLTLTNIDDDTKGISVSTGTLFTIAENAGSSTFTIVLTSDPCSTPAALQNCTSNSVTLNLTNSNTTQYSVSPTTITFGVGTWNTPRTITITPVNDNYDETTIDFNLSLDTIVSTSDYGGVNPSDVTIRITDNETAGINLTLNTGFSAVTSSGGGYTEYNMNLASQPFPGNTVNVTVSVPTASPQEGKVLAADNITQLDSRVFTFTNANWTTVQSFRVRGIAGSGTGSTNFILTASGSETGTLPPAGYSAGTYVSYNGVSSTRTITNYHIGAGKKIRLAGSTTTINESATGVPASAQFYVLLNQAPTANVTVNFGIDATYPCTLPASVGSTGQFTVDTASRVLTNANWNQLTSTNQMQITRVDDLVDDGDSSCPIRITSVSSGDPYYTGLTAADYNLPTITIIDNDARGILKQNLDPNVSGSLVTSRTGARGTLQYSLASRPMTNVTLNFTASGSNATFLPGSSLTFTPTNWNTWQTITVRGAAIGVLADVSHTITATGSSTETATGYPNSGLYNALADTQNVTKRYLLYNLVPCTTAAVGTCSAVNPTGGVVAGTYTTTEAGGQRFFAISLRAKPTSNVTMTVASSDTTEGTVSVASLVFTPANWNTLQVVTITGQNDVLTDGNINYNINFGTMASGDTAFNQTVPAITATNLDDD